MSMITNYAVEVIPAALFAAPAEFIAAPTHVVTAELVAAPATAVLGTAVDASWKASAHRVSVVGTGMKDAKRQARPPRGIPLR